MAQAASLVGISQVVCGQEWMPVEVVEGEEAVDVTVPLRVVEMLVDADAIVFGMSWLVLGVLVSVMCVCERDEDECRKKTGEQRTRVYKAECLRFVGG